MSTGHFQSGRCSSDGSGEATRASLGRAMDAEEGGGGEGGGTDFGFDIPGGGGTAEGFCFGGGGGIEETEL
jgi:hypothetical protein